MCRVWASSSSLFQTALHSFPPTLHTRTPYFIGSTLQALAALEDELAAAAALSGTSEGGGCCGGPDSGSGSGSSGSSALCAMLGELLERECAMHAAAVQAAAAMAAAAAEQACGDATGGTTTAAAVAASGGGEAGAGFVSSFSRFIGSQPRYWAHLKSDTGIQEDASVIGERHGHCLMDGLPIASKVIGLVIDERVFPLCVLPLLQPL